MDEIEKDLDPSEIEEGRLLEGLDDAPPEVRERITKTVSTLNAQKGHWRNKAIDPETKKPYKDLLAEKQNPPAPPANPPAKPEGSNEAERDFLLYNPGLVSELGREGVDELFAYARGKGIKPSDAANSEGGKFLLDGLRQKSRLANNTPAPSDRSPGGHAPKPFNALPQNEKQAGYGETVGKLIEKGRQG